MLNDFDLPSDDFQREIVAGKLGKLLTSNMDVSPLLLNGSWGSGKTTLVRRLRKYLEENEKDTNHVYINAFQEDHCENSLITIISAIARILPKDEDPELFEKAIPVIKYGLKLGAKSTLSWLLRKDFSETAQEFQDALKDASSKAIDYSIDSILKENRDSEESINNLKEILKKISLDKKIIIIIDELDRCKPNFAISIVENIKYIFDMENIRFLLVANATHLESSICHKYGKAETSKGYLDKFVKYTLDIPIYFGKRSDLKNSSVYFFHKKLNEKEIININDNSAIIQDISDLIVKNEISLREVETFIKTIEVYNTISEEKIIPNENYLKKTAKFIAIFLYCFGYKVGFKLEKIQSEGVKLKGIPGLDICESEEKLSPSIMVSILVSLCEYNDMNSSYTMIQDPKEFKYSIIDTVEHIQKQFIGYRGVPNVANIMYGVHLTLSLL